MSKQIIFWDDTRAKIFKWIEMVAKTVIVTMWPKWRNVILDKWYGTPIVTNDWVTIAREVELEDKFENMWAALVKEAANKTNEIAWDGTTTATLLTYALAREGLRNIRTWVNAVELKNGMRKASVVIAGELEKNSKTISTKSEIAQVASISAQDSEVGDIIAEAMDRVGKNWVISVEDGQTFGLSVDLTEWMQFDQGYISPYMLTNGEKMISEMRDAPILITDEKLSNMKDILPLLEQLLWSGRKDLVIIADDVDGEALTTIILNRMKWVLNVLAVKAPGFGDRKKEMLKDIAILTWATVITKDLWLKFEHASMEHLWRAKSVTISKDKTTIIGWEWDKGEIDSRVREISIQISNTKSEFDKEKLAERLAKLAGWVAVIKVGAASEVEMKEKKLRIEDALNATRAAVEEWVVAGGWVALLKAAKALEWINFWNEDQNIGAQIVARALSYPIKTIAENAWKEGSVIVSQVLSNSDINYGYDAASDEFKNMLEAWIIDPKKVERVALEQAVSLAWMFLTTEVAVCDIPKKEESIPDMSAMSWMPWMWMY